MLSALYETMQLSQAYAAFAERRNVCSAPILAVTKGELLYERLAPQISGKTIVEIGLLSLAKPITIASAREVAV
jgi:hypothetical protein